MPLILSPARAHCSGHHRPSLTWSSSLASAATAWAEHMASTGKMEHSGTPGQGENLYAASPDATFEGAVRAWLGEEREYDGGPVGEGFRRYGHYTQVGAPIQRRELGAWVHGLTYGVWWVVRLA